MIILYLTPCFPLSPDVPCIKCHSEERSDEESRGRAGDDTHRPRFSETLRSAQGDIKNTFNTKPLLRQGEGDGEGIERGAWPLLDTPVFFEITSG